MRRIMERLKLTVNEEKTHLCEIPRERFDFLGDVAAADMWPRGRQNRHPRGA
jgi:hypothetical protein